MKKLIFTLSRIIVGLLFTFSGFVKAVDPVGSAIKFGDYLTSFHLDSFAFIVIPLAFIIPALEFITGIHLLLGFRLKTYSFFALVFMLIFTPLTLGIAIFEPVTDCGCFGDAIKLSNWQTFFKNLILIIPTIYVFYFRKDFGSNLQAIRKLILSTLFIGGILFVSYYSYEHLPIIDFRPFKIGSNINDGMSIPEGAPVDEYKTTFILEKNGERKEFNADNYPYNDSTWVFIENKSEIINKGYQPPIHDFILMDDQGEDVTQDILNTSAPTLLIVSNNVSKANWNDQLDNLKNMQLNLYNQGIKTFCLTSSTTEEITNFEFGSQAGFNYLLADGTLLKTIIRSNPGLLLLQDGNVIGKWHYNDIPDAGEFKNPTSFTLKQLRAKNEKAGISIISLLALVVILLVYKQNR